VSRNLARAGVVQYEIVHLSAEFATQVSDHDPRVARFTLAGAPLDANRGGSTP